MPKYLIRLDDACHQSNWDNWDKIQQLFSKYKIIYEGFTEPTEDTLIKKSFANNYFVIDQVKANDILPYSGDIVYLDNRAQIIRDVTRTETIRIVIEF